MRYLQNDPQPTETVIMGEDPPTILAEPMLGSWVMGIVFVAAATGLILIGKNRSISTQRLIAQVALAGSICAVVALTMFPFPIGESIALRRSIASANGNGPFSVHNFVPLRTLRGTWPDSFLRQVGGNLALLFPVGLLAPLAFPKLRTGRGIVGVAVGSALLVEGTQFVLGLVLGFAYRLFDIDDLWLNAAGATIGGLIAAGVWPRLASFGKEAGTEDELLGRENQRRPTQRLV